MLMPASWRNKKVGNFGVAGTFSFQGQQVNDGR